LGKKWVVLKKPKSHYYAQKSPSRGPPGGERERRIQHREKERPMFAWGVCKKGIPQKKSLGLWWGERIIEGLGLKEKINTRPAQKRGWSSHTRSAPWVEGKDCPKRKCHSNRKPQC